MSFKGHTFSDLWSMVFGPGYINKFISQKVALKCLHKDVWHTNSYVYRITKSFIHNAYISGEDTGNVGIFKESEVA